MKPEAEQGWRRHRQEVVSGGGIPEDVVTLILSRLPLKSLGRFKAVSRAWCVLIQSLNLSPFFVGFFCRILCATRAAEYPRDRPHPPLRDDPYKDIFRFIVGGGGGGIDNKDMIDTSLSYLPTSDSCISVIDCCNGLLLLLRRSNVFNRTFYICNPLTKSWTQLYGLDSPLYCLDSRVSLLDFNPKTSPYFKIVSFSCSVPSAVLKIQALSSETMTWKHYAPVTFRHPSDHEYCHLMSRYQHHALWEGSLYLLLGNNTTDFGDAGGIMRFDLLEDHVTHPQLIELPKGTKKPCGVGIGRSRNKLCLAGLDWLNNDPHQMVLKLRVWSLSKRDQTVWVLEHDNIITFPRLTCPPIASLWTSAHIGQFHPFIDAVFIVSHNVVYSYNLKSLSLDEVCPVASNKWKVVLAGIFPFLPSMVDYSTNTKPIADLGTAPLHLHASCD